MSAQANVSAPSVVGQGFSTILMAAGLLLIICICCCCWFSMNAKPIPSPGPSPGPSPAPSSVKYTTGTENKERMLLYVKNFYTACDSAVFNELIEWSDSQGFIVVPESSPCPNSAPYRDGGALGGYIGCSPSSEKKSPPASILNKFIYQPCVAATIGTSVPRAPAPAPSAPAPRAPAPAPRAPAPAPITFSPVGAPVPMTPAPAPRAPVPVPSAPAPRAPAPAPRAPVPAPSAPLNVIGLKYQLGYTGIVTGAPNTTFAGRGQVNSTVRVRGTTLTLNVVSSSYTAADVYAQFGSPYTGTVTLEKTDGTTLSTKTVVNATGVLFNAAAI